jgi:pantoate--beta-alanine ligase
VVTKLFNIVGPCVAAFGEKDYQQLRVLQQMVADLDMPVEIVSGPIVREVDGLALSSRNAYLDPEHREAATSLYRALARVRKRALAGPLSVEEAVALARGVIEREPRARIDYIEVRDARSLRPLEQVTRGQTVMAVAAYIGKVRLIDNMSF